MYHPWLSTDQSVQHLIIFCVSVQAKVTELEAEMEDTGQMLAARLTALEPQRKKDNEDSDEAGSSSSSSSLNEIRRASKKGEEKLKSQVCVRLLL